MAHTDHDLEQTAQRVAKDMVKFAKTDEHAYRCLERKLDEIRKERLSHSGNKEEHTPIEERYKK